jgi:hypothetical protein
MSNSVLGSNLVVRVTDEVRRGLGEVALGSGLSVSDIVRGALSQFAVDAARERNVILDAVPGVDRAKVQMLVMDAGSDRKSDVANAVSNLSSIAAAYAGQAHNPLHNDAERAAYARAAQVVEGALCVARHRLERM